MKAGVKAAGADLVKQVKAVIVYKITSPDATWTIDLKNGNGSVTAGPPSGKADLTVTVSDANFVALATKKLNPQQVRLVQVFVPLLPSGDLRAHALYAQAFMKGKIKIKGNMGVAMKLGKVLEKVQPQSKL